MKKIISIYLQINSERIQEQPCKISNPSLLSEKSIGILNTLNITPPDLSQNLNNYTISKTHKEICTKEEGMEQKEAQNDITVCSDDWSAWDLSSISAEKLEPLKLVLESVDRLFKTTEKIRNGLNHLNTLIERNTRTPSSRKFQSTEVDQWLTYKNLCFPIPPDTHCISLEEHASILKSQHLLIKDLLKEVGINSLYLFSGFIDSSQANKILSSPHNSALFIEGLDTQSALHGILSHTIQWLLILNDPDVKSTMTTEGISSNELISAFVNIKLKINDPEDQDEVATQKDRTWWACSIDSTFDQWDSRKEPQIPLCQPIRLNEFLMSANNQYPLVSQLMYTCYALAINKITDLVQWLSKKEIVFRLLNDVEVFGNDTVFRVFENPEQNIQQHMPTEQYPYPLYSGIYELTEEIKTNKECSTIQIEEPCLIAPDKKLLWMRLLEIENYPIESVIEYINNSPELPLSHENAYYFILSIKDISINVRLALLEAISKKDSHLDSTIKTHKLKQYKNVTLAGISLQLTTVKSLNDRKKICDFFIEKGSFPRDDDFSDPKDFIANLSIHNSLKRELLEKIPKSPV